MGEFLGQSIIEITVLEDQCKEIRKLVAEMANYFCEEPKKFVVEEYLNMMKQFCEKLTKAKDENEQFKKQEKRRIEREKKEAEEKARREKLGIKEKPKGRRAPPPIEEKSIIDNLLDEIKNGFPLKKSQVTSPTKKEAPSTKENVDPKKARRNWKKTKALASLIVTGKQKSVEEENRKNKELSMLNSDSDSSSNGLSNGKISNGEISNGHSTAIKTNDDEHLSNGTSKSSDVKDEKVPTEPIDEVDNTSGKTTIFRESSIKPKRASVSSRTSVSSRASVSSRKSNSDVNDAIASLDDIEITEAAATKKEVTVTEAEKPSEIMRVSSPRRKKFSLDNNKVVSNNDVKLDKKQNEGVDVESSYESCSAEQAQPSQSMPNLSNDSVEEAVELDQATPRNAVSEGGLNTPKSPKPDREKPKLGWFAKFFSPQPYEKNEAE